MGDLENTDGSLDQQFPQPRAFNEPEESVSDVKGFTPRRMMTRSSVKFHRIEVSEKNKANQPSETSTDSEQEESDKDCVEKLDNFEIDEDDPPYLTGKPFFDVVLKASNIVRPLIVNIPSKIYKLLPRASIPAILRSGGKRWDVSYLGNQIHPKFDYTNWKHFVTDNTLGVGDACVFELMKNDSEMLEFRVMILRCDLPPELVASISSHGQSQVDPIDVD